MLNFNLINEIFKFCNAKDVINNFFPICKDFTFAVNHIKWFSLMKQDFTNLLSKASCEFSEMQNILTFFKENGESENSSYQICLDLSLRKMRKKKLKIFNEYFWNKEENIIYFKDIISYINSIQDLDLCNNYLGRNKMTIFNLKLALSLNQSIHLILRYNILGENENNMLNLKDCLKNNHSIQILDLINLKQTSFLIIFKKNTI